MNKTSLNLLEKVYSSEIRGAINGGPGVFQTNSKLAKKLESEGLLIRKTETFVNPPFRVNVEGYCLTLLGNIVYCMSSCNEDIDRILV